MHGLPRDFDLSFLIGKEICQVAIGRHDLQLNWGDGGISIWNTFTYKRGGTAEDVVWADDNPELAARTVPLLNTTITAAKCCERATLLLEFSNGDRLEVFEDKRYESFSIQNGQDLIIIV
jgi:hypothetical protein